MKEVDEYQVQLEYIGYLIDGYDEFPEYYRLIQVLGYSLKWEIGYRVNLKMVFSG